MGLSFYEVGIGPNEMFVFLFLKSEYKLHLIFLINKKIFWTWLSNIYILVNQNKEKKEIKFYDLGNKYI